jgi:hypothetical protein
MTPLATHGPVSRVAKNSFVSVLRRNTVVAYSIVAIACVLRSWQLGVDTNWDLLNYHLYKSTSLIEGSFFGDVAVAGFGTYLNPLIELPAGLGIALLGVRGGLLVSMAALQFVCVLCLWRLAGELTVARGRSGTIRWALVAVAITGSGALSVSFTTFGDWISAALFCESVGALLRAERSPVGARLGRTILVSGVWAGSSVGLKLTGGSFILGLLAATWLIARWKGTVQSIAGMALGFVGVAGPWMLYLQIKYSSPVYPLYNGIFGTPSGPASDLDDVRFGADSLHAVIEFPVEMFRSTARYSEIAFQDWRYLVAVSLLPIWMLARRWRPPTHDPVVLLLTVLLPGYLIWVVEFGIYRYFLFGELLCSLLVVLLIADLVPNPERAVTICASVSLLGLGFQQIPDWGRDADLAPAELATIIDQLPTTPTAVVLSAPPPLSYLLESFPVRPHAVSLWSFAAEQVRIAPPLSDDLDDLVTDGLSTDSLYVISDPGATAPIAPLEGLRFVECAPFVANDRPLEFCRLQTGAP